MLRIGGLAPFGLSLPSLLAAKKQGESSSTFGKAKRCLLLYMWGGPSHIDLFDMKPDAPSELRGPFNPVRTQTPGIRISELLPKLGSVTDKIGFIRSVTHSDNNHSTGSHWVLTGHKHPLSRENFGARPSDYPHVGSIVGKFAPARNGLPTFVALPEIIGTTAGFITPGQNAGFLGRRYDPFVVDRHPDEPDFQVPNLSPVAGLDRSRLRKRVKLSEQFDDFRRDLTSSLDVSDLNSVNQLAYDLLTSPKVAHAFDIEGEGVVERERYGMRTFGQSVLLARRLLESGVKLVTVYWHRDKPGDIKNAWDTHKDNFNQLKNRLVPQVDQPIAHLLNDLEERGMLEDTLVVWNSEFGRTPKVNKNAGRDHWGRCNTIWMAGAGVPGGQMFGKTDKIASEPVEDAVSPSDVSATLYHLLGLDPRSHFHDSLGRPYLLSEGQVLNRFLGV
ncbi:MAG: DUF1501 domain-containing protein [Opitutales bacterium]